MQQLVAVLGVNSRAEYVLTASFLQLPSESSARMGVTLLWNDTSNQHVEVELPQCSDESTDFVEAAAPVAFTPAPVASKPLQSPPTPAPQPETIVPQQQQAAASSNDEDDDLVYFRGRRIPRSQVVVVMVTPFSVLFRKQIAMTNKKLNST